MRPTRDQLRAVLLAASILIAGTAPLPAADIAPIPRLLPAAAQVLPEPDRQRLAAVLAALAPRLAAAAKDPRIADVRIFTKAVELALQDGEFFDAVKDTALADWALKEAAQRLDQLAAAPWAAQKGLVVRGYLSPVDGAALPYGLVIPEKLDLAKPAALYVWLHGRDERGTDLHFLSGCAHNRGEVHPDDAIVLQAFGRGCVGFKAAGELDVLDAITDAQAHYRIDPARIVLIGFSMGGAGAKHLGAHYADHFCAISCGAGFAETAHYNKLTPETYPPPWEQTLWGLYDAPDYVRNTFAVQFSCYSGEKDAQIQGARMMEEAYTANGRTLRHFIGPGVAHQYNPATLKEILAFVSDAVVAGRPAAPDTLTLQTRTLRYDRLFWLRAEGLEHHWADARIDAQAHGADVALTTTNITRLRVAWPHLGAASVVTVDGQKVAVGPGLPAPSLAKAEGKWSLVDAKAPVPGLRKVHGLQGPIDDAFMGPFLMVLPSGRSAQPRVQRWVEFESAHAIARWAGLMRGAARVKTDKEVTDADIRDYNLVLWGDAASNALIAKVAGKLPIRWSDQDITVGTRHFSAADHVPTLIFPNPLNPARYVVLNSGLTFREASDRTNSLQNPKLPDWAVIDLAKDPDGAAPGVIAAAGFFSESWDLAVEDPAAK